ncbi:FAST kinase domain-containing protein 2, mitochondrial isoform 1-T2 [Aulostomus maculatus]
MSVLLTQEVMRGSLRLWSRGCPWKRGGFLVTSSTMDVSLPCQQLGHIQGAVRIQTNLVRARFSPVRFFTEERTPKEELGEQVCAASPPPSEFEFQSASPFERQLKPCDSPSEVLDLLSQYPLEVQILSSSLSKMWHTTKKMSPEQLQRELDLMFDHPAFLKTIQFAMANVATMRNGSITSCLLYMFNLGVPQHSRVIQLYLRTCQERLNTMDGKSLSILASCLAGMKRSSLVVALKDGLRLKVKSDLSESVWTVKNLQTLMDGLAREAPLDLKQNLVRKAFSMSSEFRVTHCQQMIAIMDKMKLSFEPLLDICSEKIKEDVDAISFRGLCAMLRSFGRLRYRNIPLLTAISDNVTSVRDTWTHSKVILILSLLNNLGFSDALMEMHAERVIADPHKLTLKDIVHTLRLYSSLNFDLQHRRRQFLDALSQELDCHLPRMPAFELLQTVHYLCLLGHFPSEPLEKLLQGSTLDKLRSTASVFIQSQEQMFQNVSLCLKLEYPVPPQPPPVPPAFLGKPRTPSANQDLLQALRQLVEERADLALQEMVMVETFYCLDAVITKLLPDQTSTTEASGFAGEPSPAESSEKIAVLCLPDSSFCADASRLLGPSAVMVRHLKMLGYKPVLVKVNELSGGNGPEILRERIFPGGADPPGASGGATEV